MKMNMNKKMKIYIAGPYTPMNSNLHDAAWVANKNVKKAIMAGIQIIRKGHSPFIPHLTHFIHLETDEPLPKEFYYEYDIEWLKLCDALLYLAPSNGADIELNIAKNMNLIIYKNIEEIPNYIPFT